MVAPMVAVSNKHISFIVLLAAPGVPIDALMLKQLELISGDSKMSDSIISIAKGINTDVFHALQSENDNTKAGENIKEIYKNHLLKYSEDQKKEMGYSPAAIESAILQFMTPWFRYLY